MKKIVPVILFALVPLFYSCVGREQADYNPAQASISAINNGQNWTAALTDTLLNDTLTLHAQWKHDLLRLKFPVSASNYPVAFNNGHYFTTGNTGQVTQTYKLDVNYPNTVNSIVNNTVSSINKYVTGQFKLRFIIDPLANNTDTTGIDTITLINGQFTAPYK